jgi:conjugal transfer pilus assembly protein TraK
MPKIRFLSLLLALPLLLGNVQANAQDKPDLGKAPGASIVVDGAPIVIDSDGWGVRSAVISSKESTRLVIYGGRAKDLKYFKEDVTATKDEVTGQYFITPTTKGATKPINVWLISESNITHGLTLQPVDMTPRAILVRETGKPEVKSKKAVAIKGDSYAENLRQLTTVIAKDEEPQDFEVKPVNAEIPLWKEAYFVLQKQYMGVNLVAEKYLLRNISNQTMRLAEQEFYQKGVVAVSIELQELPPSGETNVIVIRSAQGER